MFKHLISMTLISSVLLASAAWRASDCHIIYDAGSSGTRLYIYQQQGEQWLTHTGPKVSALADPVREIRGKTWADAGRVTDEVIAALADIRVPGPDSKGKPKWPAFDWQQQCDVKSARVLATAGMRIAEQENRLHARELWQMLSKKLSTTVGSGVTVDTRTITGFEEGLYAWLALRDDRDSNDYGIAEMGGASAQITFPCTDCDNSHNAVRTVLVDGKSVKMYSYSFLGLGQDEAPKTLTDAGASGVPAECAYNIGARQPGWQPASCGTEIHLTDSQGVKDPYNYEAGIHGAHNQPPIQHNSPSQWFLTGAFAHMAPTDVASCCEDGGQCYNQEYSCFSSVYRLKYLDTLSIPSTSDKADASWTAGANICGATDCLSEAKSAPICRWSDEGCL